MRAVVTGGAGFLGSHLVRRLLAEGCEVIALDNLVTGSKENIAHLPVEFLEQDVSESFDIRGQIDYVFHFASPASVVDFLRIPIEVLKAGSTGTYNSLELAIAKGAKFMFASTSEVYGDPAVSPQPETYWGNVNPVGTRSSYDEAKRFGEALTMAYCRHRGVDTRIARFFNTYGPGMRLDDGRVVPNFIVQALRGDPLTVYGDGLQTRSFSYVDDVVEAIWRLANADFHEPVNIGTQDEHTMLDFARIVLEVTGSGSPIDYLPAPADDPRQRRPDLARNRQVLGNWVPKVDLREGLRRTAEDFSKRIVSAAGKR